VPHDLRQLICVPLVYRQKFLGVLRSGFNSRGKPFFDNEDLALLESFADLATVAIIRARLLEHRIEQERFRAEITDHPHSGWFDEARPEGGDVVGKAPKGDHCKLLVLLIAIPFPTREEKRPVISLYRSGL
jgi:hypothetical protein